MPMRIALFTAPALLPRTPAPGRAAESSHVPTIITITRPPTTRKPFDNFRMHRNNMEAPLMTQMTLRMSRMTPVPEMVAP